MTVETMMSRIDPSSGAAPTMPIVDAYSRPRRMTEGCQHRMGCRCETPFWLREFSPAELARIERNSLAGEGKDIA